MAETDVFCLSKLKIFEGIKENTPKDSREIVDVYEDLLFLWNFKSNNLRVANWRSAQCKDRMEVKFQVICF